MVLLFKFNSVRYECLHHSKHQGVSGYIVWDTKVYKHLCHSEQQGGKYLDCNFMFKKWVLQKNLCHIKGVNMVGAFRQVIISYK